MPWPESNTVSPLIAMRPRSGRRIPAMALTTEVLPAPDRPKSAVTPSPASNDAARRKSLSPRSISTDSIFAGHPARCPAHQDLGHIEGRQRQQHRDHAQAQRRGVPGRSLGVGVDRERQGARLARNVRDEGDGRSELAETARERKQNASDDAGKREWQCDGEKNTDPARPERARRGLELAVYRLEGKPDRAHHQWEAHDARRERGAGPAESDHDAEPLIENLANRSAAAEEQQEKKPNDDRRQHQREVHGYVKKRLARKADARQNVGDGDGQGQADEHAPEGDAQAEPENLGLLRGDTHWNWEIGLRLPRTRISGKSRAPPACSARRRTPPLRPWPRQSRR